MQKLLLVSSMLIFCNTSLSAQSVLNIDEARARAEQQEPRLAALREDGQLYEAQRKTYMFVYLDGVQPVRVIVDARTGTILASDLTNENLGQTERPSQQQVAEKDNRNYNECISFDTASNRLATFIENNCDKRLTVSLFYENGQTGLEFVAPLARQSTPRFSEFDGLDGYAACAYPAVAERQLDRKFSCPRP